MQSIQTYYPVANSVGPQQVRETESAYIIEDVPIVRPMELAGGYVPEESVRDTAGAWDGTPATLNHPRNERGEPVAANRQPETHLGGTEETYYDGTHVRGNIRVKKRRLDSVGGEATDIRRALENGQPIDVSSQYAAEPLPPGRYDGEHRSNVERITRPDSVAILPNKQGVCSIEDGCGINPQLAANADVSVPMRANKYGNKEMDAAAEADFEAGDLVRWSTSASPGTGRVNTVTVEPGETVSADGADVTREATEDEPAYKLDDWVGPEAGFERGVVVKSGSELIGEWDDAPEAAMSANVEVPEKYRLDNPGEAVEMAQEMGFDGAGDEVIHTHGEGEDTEFMPAPSHEALVQALREMGELPGGSEMSDNALVEAFRALRQAIMGADDGEIPEDSPDTTTPTPNSADDDVDRQRLIDEVVANSPLSEAALEARCNDGLRAIHSDVMAAAANAVGDDDWSAELRYFRIVPAEDDEDRFEDNVLGIGVDFPESGVYVDWHTAAFPDELDDPHVSEYGSVADLKKATGNMVVDMTAPSGESVTNNTDDGPTDDPQTPDTDMTDDPIELDDLSDDAQDALVDEAVERIEANREDNEKEDVVTEIIANSADYDSDDREELLETPLSVLKNMRANATPAAPGVPGVGHSANAGGVPIDDEIDDYPDGVLD